MDPPYTIEFERVDDAPRELSLWVTGDLYSLGTVTNGSLSPSTVGTQAISTMDGAIARFSFTGEIRRLSGGPSVIASTTT